MPLLARLEFWAFLVMLLALAQVPAEWYLASFGPSGMRDLNDWNLLTAAAYYVRHLPTLTFLMIPLLAAVLPAALALAFLHAPSSGRRVSRGSLMITVIAVSLAVAPDWPFREIRRAALHRTADRMAPLVAAIERFEADARRPPYELTELTPRYLSNVEAFGVRGCRPLQYSVATPDVAWRWQLWLECPNGMLTLDHFSFRPNRDYSKWWGNMERLGDWAYSWD